MTIGSDQLDAWGRPGRLLITGSRHWSDSEAMLRALKSAFNEMLSQGYREIILVHGDATGADRMAEDLWRQTGMPVERHPANWRAHGRLAGPVRNRAMVAAGADLCLAFPLGESKGTRGCMREAARAGIPTRVIEKEST